MAVTVERMMCGAQRWSLAQSLKEQPRAAHIMGRCLPSDATLIIYCASRHIAEHQSKKVTSLGRKVDLKSN